MTVALAALPQFFDNAGNPLSGGLLYTYVAGTSTPLATYTDRSGSTPNANPVVLDSSGRADIWLTTNTAYKLVLKDSVGNTIDTTDDFYAGADPAQLTAAGIVPATGGTYTGPVIFSGGVTFSGTAAQDLATLDSLNIASVQNANLWTNSDMGIWQRQVASVADANYGFDRVVNLCDTGSTTLSQLAQPTDGIPYAMRSTQPDAGAKRFGFAQIVEARDCRAYRGKNLVFALKVRCSASTTIRCALVAWTSTADSPTGDVVNNWASTTYTAGNFFVANTSTIAVAATSVTAATWTDLVVSSTSPGGVVAPTTMNNLYMVVWTDTAQAQNVTLDASVLRCGQGTEAPLWTPPNTSLEFQKCKRFYQTSYPYGTAAGSASLTGNNGRAIGIDVNTAIVFAHYEEEMRVAPAITTYQPATGTVATIRSVGGASIAIAGPTLIGTRGVGVTYTSAGLFTAGTIYDFNWVAAAELGV